MSIEKIWKTRAGHKAVVIFTRESHRCGYVGVPEGHPLYGKSYGEQLDCLKVLEDAEPVGERSPIALLIAAGSGNYQSVDIAFDVHGSVTWADYLVDPKGDEGAELTAWGKAAIEAGLKDGLWYIGYDCAHYGDGTLGPHGSDGPVRSLEYCEQQCESLSQQIIERVIYE